MAGHVGGDIITDGLVTFFDSYNSKSYPGSGTTFYDLSLKENNGTINGNPTYANNVFTLDQSGDTVTTSTTMSSLGVSDTALSAVVFLKRDSSPPQNSQGHFGWSNTTTSFKSTTKFFVDAYSTLSTRYVKDFHSATDFTNLHEFNWVCLGFTVSSNVFKTYTNGDFYQTTTMDANLESIQSLTVNFGAGNGYYSLYGKVGACMLYNTTLSDADIKRNFNAFAGRYGI